MLPAMWIEPVTTEQGISIVRMLRPLTAAAALVALVAGQTAMAQAAPCITPAELRGLVRYTLPVAMGAVIKACKPNLAPGSYLNTDGAGLIAQYAAGKDAAWPVAKSAVFKLYADNGKKLPEIVKGLPDSALQPMADGIIAKAVIEKLPTSTCVPFEHMTQLLAPLPPDNMIEMISYVVTLAVAPKKSEQTDGMVHHHDLSICPAGA